MELRKQCGWSATRPELFYWQTASGQEVDIVLEDRAGRVVGVEVKAAASLGTSDVRGLQALATAVGKKWVRGVLIPHLLIHRGMIDQVPVIAEIPLGRLGSQGYL